ANKAFCLAGSSVAPHTPTNAGGGDTGGTTPPGGGPGGPDTGTGMGTGPGPGGGGGGGGGGANGVTVKLNVVAPIVPPAPSLTVKVKLSFVLTAPLWTNTSRPALMSACVKLVIATPGAVVSSSWPFRGAVVTA